MELPQALAQIAEIRAQAAKAEVYRGYRSLPVAASGLVGLAAAWFQPAGLSADPIGFVIYWVIVAACAGFVGVSEIVYNYVVHDETLTRRRTRRVVGQLLPSLCAGALVTASFAQSSPRTGPLAAWPLGAGVRSWHLCVAPVPGARERMGGAVLLRGRRRAALDRARTRDAERVGGRRHVRRRPALHRRRVVLESRAGRVAMRS